MYLQVENITKCYGEKKVLKDISLQIEEGDFVSILGPNGCGKTTLINIISGVDLNYTGSVFFKGDNYSRIPANKRPFNSVFQKNTLFPNLTVEENILFGPKVQKLDKNIYSGIFDELISQLEVQDLLTRKATELSGGETQRICIARALINRPKILLFDEAFSALDPISKTTIKKVLKDYHTKGGTILFVTHNREEALELSNKILIIDNGDQIAFDNKNNLYNYPQNPIAVNFLYESHHFNVNFIKGEGDLLLFRYNQIDLKVNNEKLSTDFAINKTSEISLFVRIADMCLSDEIPTQVTGINNIEGSINEIIHLGGDHYKYGILIKDETIYINDQNEKQRFDLNDVVTCYWKISDTHLINKNYFKK